MTIESEEFIARTSGVSPLEVGVLHRQDGSTELTTGGRQFTMEPAGMHGFVGEITQTDQDSTDLAPITLAIGSIINRTLLSHELGQPTRSQEVIVFKSTQETARLNERQIVDVVRSAVGPRGQLDDWASMYHFPSALYTEATYGWLPSWMKHIGYRYNSGPKGPGEIHDDHCFMHTNPSTDHLSLLFTAKTGLTEELESNRSMTDHERAQRPLAERRSTAFILKSGIASHLIATYHAHLMRLEGYPAGIWSAGMPFGWIPSSLGESFPGADELGVERLQATHNPLLMPHREQWSLAYNPYGEGVLDDLADPLIAADMLEDIHGMLGEHERVYVLPQDRVGTITAWAGKGVAHRANGDPFSAKTTMLWRVTANHFIDRSVMDEQNPKTTTMSSPGRTHTEQELDRIADGIMSQF